MGKITFNGKDITKPFDYNGKKVVSLTYNGKVCTLSAGGGGGSCGPYDHEFPNGFKYSGVWPAAYQSILEQCKTSTDGNGIEINYIPGITALEIPWLSLDKLNGCPDLICLTFTTATSAIGGRFITDRYGGHTKLEVLNIPEMTLVGEYGIRSLESLKTLNAPKLTEIGHAGFSSIGLTEFISDTVITLGDSAMSTSRRLKTVKLPNCTSVGQYAFSSCNSLVEVYLPNANNIGSGSFTGMKDKSVIHFTLKSKFNTDAEKLRLFSRYVDWSTFTFTWV